MSTTKPVIQVTTREGGKHGILHFQVGQLNSYSKLDLNATGKESFKGLKTATSLFGSSTTYYLINPASLGKGKMGSFRSKRRFPAGLSKVLSLYTKVKNGAEVEE